MKQSKSFILVLALVPSLAMAQGVSSNVKQMDTAAGPLTVTWGQPDLAKANEYHVRIADLDRDGDGKLSRREIPAGHALQFEFRVVDSNRDGKLSEKELSSWR